MSSKNDDEIGFVLDDSAEWEKLERDSDRFIEEIILKEGGQEALDDYRKKIAEEK